MAAAPLPFLLRLVRKQRVKLLTSCICSAASAVFGLIPYVLVFRIAEQLLEPSIDWAPGRQFILLALVSILLRFALMAASTMLAHAAAFHVLYDLRVRLIEKLGKLPLGFFSEQHSGRVKKVAADDVERIEAFIAHHLPDLTASIVAPLLTAAYLFIVDWRLALAALLPIPAAYAVQGMMLMRGKRSTDMKRMHDLSEAMNGAIVEFIHAMPVIKSFNQTVHSFARYRHSVESYAALWSQIARRKTPLYTLFLLLLESGLLFIMLLGVWMYGQQMIPLPVLVLFLLLGVGLTAPLRQISTLGHMMQNNVEGVRRIQQLLEGKEQAEGLAAALPLPERFDIAFRQVRFGYEERQVLRGIDFVAEHGKVTALVGPSGAGKSTIAGLISRYWDVTEGAVKIGGVDVRDMRSEELLASISMVQQQPYLFNETIADNIRMGRPAATDAEVVEAAQAAHCHEFIMKLPLGYGTIAGEGGAMLKDAPIIILDEATASLDPENEVHLQRAITKLTHRKTVLVIAHRLKTIRGADSIIVVEQRRIAETGTHDELLAQGGLYHRLWQEQQKIGGWKIGGGHRPA
ncbi:ABC transporter ATP-binding protein [Paenibacillus thiaminolyticus]|nr:ABC transporter ATP-binding protein [Paenibacillus thiaminolyticus]